MKWVIVDAYGVKATVYEGNEGDELPWHNHPLPHGHVVIKGRTKVEMEGLDPIEMSSGIPNKELPAIIKHRIVILKNNTIFMNIMKDDGGSDPILSKSGGVMLVSGEIVYETT